MTATLAALQNTLIAQTSTTSGSSISWELIMIVAIAAVVIMGVAWLALKGSGGTSD